MHSKSIAMLALAGYALAQNDTQSLNATLSGNENLSNLTALLSTVPELLAVLGGTSNITILAPSNEAFAEFQNSSQAEMATDPEYLAALLSYHVLNGTYTASQISNTSAFVPTLLVNSSYSNVTGGQVVEAIARDDSVVFYSGLLANSTVTQADVNFTGGVVHVIDHVLTIPASVLDTASAAGLTSLRGALNATDRLEAASAPDLTIFAPNNEAFQSIGSALSNLSVSDLQGILDYHIVNGSVRYSSTLENGTTLTAVNGDELTITVEDGNVFVNAARVIVPNVLIANGVVHVIDNILNPSNTTGPTESATAGAPAYSGSSVSEAPFTSGQPTPSTTINPTEAGPGAQPTSSGASDSPGAAMPMATGSLGYSALFGVGAAVMLGGF